MDQEMEASKPGAYLATHEEQKAMSTKQNCPNCQFSIDEGMKVQMDHLNEWSTVLQPGVMNDVKHIATHSNHLAQCGHDIIRGDAISEIISRIKRDIAIAKKASNS